MEGSGKILGQEGTRCNLDPEPLNILSLPSEPPGWCLIRKCDQGGKGEVWAGTRGDDIYISHLLFAHFHMNLGCIFSPVVTGIEFI